MPRRTRGPAPLPVKKLRELTLAGATAAGRAQYLSAASGLVRSGGELYVVADDEQYLARFGATGARPGRLLRLFEGALPEAPRARKKRKADLEILLRLPAMTGCRHGALLALGSGSKKRRRRGALLPLDAMGKVRGARVRPVDAAPLYARLAREFDELNLEGGWVHRGPYPCA
jgi:hypothetical protein